MTAQRMLVTVGLTALLVTGGSLTAYAGPTSGLYTSTEFGGLVEDGRWSESWMSGAPGQAGNIVHAQSYVEVSPGVFAATNQWEIAGPTLAGTPLVLLDTVVNGTGTRIYYTQYTGGTMLLGNTGPWWNPLDVGSGYLVDIDHYSHTTQVEYLNGVLQESTTTVRLDGSLPSYPAAELSLAVAVAVPRGQGANAPADYPEFLPSNPDAPYGEYGVVQKIRMTLTPEPATLAFVGLGFGALVLRRRRR